VPRSASSIHQLSAVAASQYALGTNYQTLIEARNERAWMAERYHARPIEAKQPDVDAWLDTTPRPPGHLGHIALHGFSDPAAGAQGVVLGDGSVLTPYRLAGEYYDGLTPRFEMLFLNACQVGTAGERLGRIAGFPGAMLSGGACGFIGPLWEVQDGVARRVAVDFYRRTLESEEEVGEALRAIRASQPIDGSITPWAYLYYGHPRLRLTLAQ
jgi:CHAT domain-containing protein